MSGSPKPASPAAPPGEGEASTPSGTPVSAAAAGEGRSGGGVVEAGTLERLAEDMFTKVAAYVNGELTYTAEDYALLVVCTRRKRERERERERA